MNIQILALAAISGALFSSCIAAEPAGSTSGSTATEERGFLVEPTRYALSSALVGDDLPEFTVDLCFLTKGATELVHGTVERGEGLVYPADLCELDQWRFDTPHWEIELRLADGSTRDIVLLSNGVYRQDEIQVGDELFGGVRSVGGDDFLMTFVFVNPTRAQPTGRIDLPSIDVATAEPPKEECREFAETDQQFLDRVTRPPHINCSNEVDEPLEEDNDDTRP